MDKRCSGRASAVSGGVQSKGGDCGGADLCIFSLVLLFALVLGEKLESFHCSLLLIL